MKLIQSPELDAYFNLAAEEYIFSQLDPREEYLRLWQNQNAVIVGKHQNTIEEINSAYVSEHAIQVVRRITGGGAVYHDLGNLNFTFVLKIESSKINFRALSQPIMDALRSLGLDVQFSGRNDLTLDGKKFSGNAQHIKSGRILHHGTLLFNSNLEILSQVLAVKADKIESKGVKSVRSRVTNISEYLPGMNILEFKSTLEQTIVPGQNLSRYTFTEADLAAISDLREQKYSSWEWNYGRSPEFDLRKERRFSDGSLSIYLLVEAGIIQSARILGDFFGSGDIQTVETRLQSVKLRESDIQSALAPLDIGHYIYGLTAEELAKIIVY
jgi:lipoate---protein ligase